MDLLFAGINVIAFLLAIWQTYKAHAQTRDAQELTRQIADQSRKQNQLLSSTTIQSDRLQEQLQQIEEIRLQLTTRFIGKFPDYMSQVVALLEQSEEEIIIFCDMPAYGCFSAAENHVRYRQVIESKILAGKKVELTCLHKDGRRDVFHERFSHNNDEEWKQWKEEKRQLLNRLLFYYGDGLTLEELSKGDFWVILEKLDDGMLERELANKVIEVTVPMPILFWIRDNKEGIFAIHSSSYSANFTSLGFKTSDRALISAFREISKRYREHYRL